MQDSAEDFDRSTERHAPWQKPNALPRLAARKKAKSSLIYNESEEKKKREHYMYLRICVVEVGQISARGNSRNAFSFFDLHLRLCHLQIGRLVCSEGLKQRLEGFVSPRNCL